MGILHEEVSGWGMCALTWLPWSPKKSPASHATTREIPHHDVASQTADASPTQASLTADNSDVTSAIRKGQFRRPRHNCYAMHKLLVNKFDKSFI
jgi:hypothetical protein